ncbi:MAG TPA: saccharopine dehydrogenase NADP-binding domain-containing protein [Candidatus Limnocylindrales bacterium]|nr:saccharopine dehydrogenase NADP-binding domain-containing protein [Candidatus Limnocylindrales bacterium]
MSDEVRFGVVGGYGATGRAVVCELLQSGDGEIRIGGRDLAKGKALATEFGARVMAAQVDVLNAQSLDDFCGGCSIVVNCAGPVSGLRDRVAQAAFRRRCHYLDVAGLMFVKEGMAPHAREIERLGLRFVISAGWLPGLSELLPVYANALARTRMESIESLTIYFGDSGEWSESAYRDMAWFVRNTGLRSPFCFRKGVRAKAKMSQASIKVDLGGRIGLQRFSLYSIPEMDEAAMSMKHCDVFTYSYVPSARAALAVSLFALLPLSEQQGVRLLRWGLQEVPLQVGGVVAARVLGKSEGRKLALTAEIVYEKHRDYWVNALVAATVARMIADGNGVKAGVNNLADAVDPASFLAELRNKGLEQTEKFEPAN